MAASSALLEQLEQVAAFAANISGPGGSAAAAAGSGAAAAAHASDENDLRSTAAADMMIEDALCVDSLQAALADIEYAAVEMLSPFEALIGRAQHELAQGRHERVAPSNVDALLRDSVRHAFIEAVTGGVVPSSSMRATPSFVPTRTVAAALPRKSILLTPACVVVSFWRDAASAQRLAAGFAAFAEHLTRKREDPCGLWLQTLMSACHVVSGCGLFATAVYLPPIRRMIDREFLEEDGFFQKPALGGSAVVGGDEAQSEEQKLKEANCFITPRSWQEIMASYRSFGVGDGVGGTAVVIRPPENFFPSTATSHVSASSSSSLSSSNNNNNYNYNNSNSTVPALQTIQRILRQVVSRTAMELDGISKRRAWEMLRERLGQVLEAVAEKEEVVKLLSLSSSSSSSSSSELLLNELGVVFTANNSSLRLLGREEDEKREKDGASTSPAAAAVTTTMPNKSAFRRKWQAVWAEDLNDQSAAPLRVLTLSSNSAVMMATAGSASSSSSPARRRQEIEASLRFVFGDANISFHDEGECDDSCESGDRCCGWFKIHASALRYGAHLFENLPRCNLSWTAVAQYMLRFVENELLGFKQQEHDQQEGRQEGQQQRRTTSATNNRLSSLQCSMAALAIRLLLCGGVARIDALSDQLARHIGHAAVLTCFRGCDDTTHRIFDCFLGRVVPDDFGRFATSPSHGENVAAALHAIVEQAEDFAANVVRDTRKDTRSLTESANARLRQVEFALVPMVFSAVKSAFGCHFLVAECVADVIAFRYAPLLAQLLSFEMAARLHTRRAELAVPILPNSVAFTRERLMCAGFAALSLLCPNLNFFNEFQRVRSSTEVASVIIVAADRLRRLLRRIFHAQQQQRQREEEEGEAEDQDALVFEELPMCVLKVSAVLRVATGFTNLVDQVSGDEEYNEKAAAGGGAASAAAASAGMSTKDRALAFMMDNASHCARSTKRCQVAAALRIQRFLRSSDEFCERAQERTQRRRFEREVRSHKARSRVLRWKIEELDAGRESTLLTREGEVRCRGVIDAVVAPSPAAFRSIQNEQRELLLTSPPSQTQQQQQEEGTANQQHHHQQQHQDPAPAAGAEVSAATEVSASPLSPSPSSALATPLVASESTTTPAAHAASSSKRSRRGAGAALSVREQAELMRKRLEGTENEVVAVPHLVPPLAERINADEGAARHALGEQQEPQEWAHLLMFIHEEVKRVRMTPDDRAALKVQCAWRCFVARTELRLAILRRLHAVRRGGAGGAGGGARS